MTCDNCIELGRQRDDAENERDRLLAIIKIVRGYVKLALDELRRDVTNEVAVRMIDSHLNEVFDEDGRSILDA